MTIKKIEANRNTAIIDAESEKVDSICLSQIFANAQ